jgi:LysM domain
VRHHAEVTGRLGPGRRAITIACLVLAGCAPPASEGSGAPSRSAGPTPPASPSGQPSFVRPTPNPSPTFLVHEVEAGESLTSIARAYGTTARSIAYWNRDRYPSLDPDSDAYSPDRIVVGWTLRLIPTAVVDEDELPERTLAPTPASPPASPSVDPDAASPAADASPA